jgi:hypothetical protein
MRYLDTVVKMLRANTAFNDIEAKMMPQMEKSEMGAKLTEHHPITSKVETQPYGMALKKI